MTGANKCRFGCQDIENYNHLFISCPKLLQLKTHMENTMKHLGFTIKLTMKISIFGYKLTYNAYTDVNKFLCHLQILAEKDNSINLKQWVLNQLRRMKSLHSCTKYKFHLLSKFIDKWLQLDQV